jgi:hypothetical protein
MRSFAGIAYVRCSPLAMRLRDCSVVNGWAFSEHGVSSFSDVRFCDCASYKPGVPVHSGPCDKGIRVLLGRTKLVSVE